MNFYFSVYHTIYKLLSTSFFLIDIRLEVGSLTVDFTLTS